MAQNRKAWVGSRCGPEVQGGGGDRRLRLWGTAVVGLGPGKLMLVTCWVLLLTSLPGEGGWEGAISVCCMRRISSPVFAACGLVVFALCVYVRAHAHTRNAYNDVQVQAG